jgi:hypothetical protein
MALNTRQDSIAGPQTAIDKMQIDAMKGIHHEILPTSL